MTLCTSRSAVIALIIFMALPASGQQYLLYSPQTVTTGQKVPKDGILVREIEVRKGDTLYDLSRKFSGRGMYYPQILLFNSIKNPNLIYPGNTLKIPVTENETNEADHADKKHTGASRKPKASRDKKSSLNTETESTSLQPRGSSSVSTPSTELSLSDLKTVGTAKSSISRHKKKTAVPMNKKPPYDSPAATTHLSPLPAAHKSAAVVAPATEAAAGQKLFEAAVKAYRQDDCRTALELLDRYLADNAGSPLAADATLYKAECYLKLSAQ